MKTEKNNSRLLRDRDIAALLAISRSYVWRLVRERRLPEPVRLGSKLSIWKLSDIQRFLDRPELLAGSE